MLRNRFLVAFMLTVVLATSYFYLTFSSVCALPLTYAVVEVDERFKLNQADVETAVSEATAIWENSLNQDIFRPTVDTTTADLLISFIFDERQERTTAEVRERERLAAVEALSGEVQATYERLAADIGEREAAYERDAAAYDRALARYNSIVAEYNTEGGAPPEVFDELALEAERLNQEAERLSAELVGINDGIDDLNQLAAEGSVLVSRFNERVDDFNATFADGREFTQGDYRNGEINIYSFTDFEELNVVLVHELGHALGIDHVPDPVAYMHYLLGAQLAGQPLQPDDIAAFVATCSSTARLATVPQPWRTAFAWLAN